MTTVCHPVMYFEESDCHINEIGKSVTNRISTPDLSPYTPGLALLHLWALFLGVATSTGDVV